MHYSEEEKTMWLDDWRQSGKKAWTYAKANGICPQTFIRWTKVMPEARSELIEIPRSIMAATKQQEPELLIEKGDVKIHIPLEWVRGELGTVIETLVQSL